MSLRQNIFINNLEIPDGVIGTILIDRQNNMDIKIDKKILRILFTECENMNITIEDCIGDATFYKCKNCNIKIGKAGISSIENCLNIKMTTDDLLTGLASFNIYHNKIPINVLFGNRMFYLKGECTYDVPDIFKYPLQLCRIK